MKFTLNRKTTAGVLAVFTKAIADLKQVEEYNSKKADDLNDRAADLLDAAEAAGEEASQAAIVRRKLEELVQG